MPNQITYYKNLTETTHSEAIGIKSPDFELIQFEKIKEEYMTKDQPFRLNGYVIGLLIGGDAKLAINSTEYELQRGSLYFSNPWHIRNYVDVNEWKGYLLYFSQEFFHQFTGIDTINKDFPFFNYKNGYNYQLNEEELNEVLGLFYEVSNVIADTGSDKYRILFHHLNLLLFKCKAVTGVQPENNNVQESIVSKFIEYLNQYFVSLNKGSIDKELTLKNVAQDLFLHPNYLSNLIKIQTGKSAAQMIRERIALEAQALLKNTGMTVAEIAYYLQFKDTSNFAKFFKGLSGVSPTTYRSDKEVEV
jgi:AraC family transcriptional regulator, transcriptional activator of pobA